MLAKDYMTRVNISVPETMSITELTALLRRNRVGGAPVINSKGETIGIVTVSDIFNAIQIVRRLHSFEEAWASLFRKSSKNVTVRDIYTHGFFSVLAEAPIEAVVELMLEKNIHTIPVISDDQKTIIGVIGRHDVTWAIFGLESPV